MSLGRPAPATLATAMILAAILATPSAAQQYEITDLGTLGGNYSDAYSFSGTGVIAGQAAIASGPLHASLWDESGVTDIGTPPGGFGAAKAVAINPAGQVAAKTEVGTSYAAWFWENGSWTQIPPLPGHTDAFAEDIDSFGRVVGRSLTPGPSGPPTAGFLWENGVMTDLGTLGDATYAWAINDGGTIVGGSIATLPDGTNRWRGFRWEDGVMTALDPATGWTEAQALDINQAGDIVGSSWVVLSPSFLWADDATLWRSTGEVLTLGLTPGPPVCVFEFPFYTENIARAINNRGDVVGDAACISSGASQAGFLWKDGVMHNLNDLIPPGTGWNLRTARDINDDGEIVGQGFAPNGDFHGYLLTPVGPPVAVTPGSPTRHEVLTASPSPFRELTRVTFDLPAPASVRLTVHDVRGRRVATLAEGDRAPGRHTIGWGARGESGEPLPGGVYFVRLEAGAETATRKVVLRR